VCGPSIYGWPRSSSLITCPHTTFLRISLCSDEGDFGKYLSGDEERKTTEEIKEDIKELFGLKEIK